MDDQTKEMKDSVTTSLQKQSGGNGEGADIYALIKKQTPGFKMALPKDFDADRFTRLVLTALRGSEKLRSCNPASVLAAVMLSAQAGLEPNTPLHEASIIPFGREATFQIEYRGFLKLVWNSGLVARIDYDKVCENDHFVHKKGFEEVFEHEPLLKSDRGKAYAYYAQAELIGGGRALIVKSLDDVKKHAIRFSKSYKKGPWQTDFDSMAIKTCLKELCDKKLPKKTTNEALKFHNIVARDGTVSKLTDHQISASEMGELLKTDEIESEAVYEDVPEETKTDTAAPPEFFITQINQATTKKAVDGILNNNAVQALGKEAKEKVDKAGMERIKELTAKE